MIQPTLRIRSLASVLACSTLFGSLLSGSTLLISSTLMSSAAQAQEMQASMGVPDTAPRIYVDPVNGSDSGDGSATSPLKTITLALSRSTSGTVVQLQPGLYSAENGEVFPLRLKSGQILRGDESKLGEGYEIVGGGTFISPTLGRQNIALLADTGSEIRGISMRNEGRRGYAVWVESSAPKIYNNTFTGSVHDGVFMAGSSSPWIEGNRFYKNGANGISILGTSSPTVINNLFQETGFGITIDQKSTPKIENNRIIKNKSGVVVGGSSQPMLRGNFISQNLDTGLVAITKAQPNMGTSDSPGNNIFEANGKLDINNAVPGLTLLANGNKLSGDRLKGTVDTAGQPTLVALNGSAPAAVDQPLASASGTLPAPAAPAVTVPGGKPAPVANVGTLPTLPVPATSGTKAAPPLPTLNSVPTTGSNPKPPFQSVPFAPSQSTPATATAPATATPANPPASKPPLFNPSTALANVSGSLPPAAPASAPQTMPLLSNGTAPNPKSSAPLSGAPNTVAARSTGERFRILVTPKGAEDLGRLQKLVPGAIQTTLNGQTVLVAGLFDTRSQAEQMLDRLFSEGFSAAAEVVTP